MESDDCNLFSFPSAQKKSERAYQFTIVINIQVIKHAANHSFDLGSLIFFRKCV